MTRKLPENYVKSVLVGEEFKNDGDRDWKGNFKCFCGEMFEAIGYHVRSGGTKSCGCLLGFGNNTKHGYSDKSIYYIWENMLDRCTNTNHKQYTDYGGRGIKVCDEWYEFENFLADMGEPPDGLSLDRIDNDGGYCKENCRWTTAKEQANNRRNNIFLTCINGTRMTITQWARKLHVDPKTFRQRKYRGWTDEEVLRTEIERENYK